GNPPHEPSGHFGGIPLDLSRLPSRYPGQWKVLQARVEQVLAAWAARLGADIRRGHEVYAMTTGRDGGAVRGRTPGGARRPTGSYLVGCDGQESTVAQLAGAPFAGPGATHELLRADVSGIEVPNRRFERLPNGLAISARRPDDVTRVMVAAFDRPAGHRVGQP